MERCSTARCGGVMGDLRRRTGFSAPLISLVTELLIADTEEGWVMHFVPYPETNSAVWSRNACRTTRWLWS